MLKNLLLMMTALFSVSTFAESDLELPGEKWLAKNTGYLCNAFGTEVAAPATHDLYNIKFTQLSTDSTLDNVRVLASFNQDGAECSYSLILLADNDAGTTKYVDSKAYAVNGSSDCLAGKELLDEQLAANDYLYWGHPHHVTLMITEESAAAICGTDAERVGIDFTVSGIIQNGQVITRRRR